MADPCVLLEKCPCDTCRYHFHCEHTGDACRAFMMFVNGRNFDFEPRQPRADLGKRLKLTAPAF